MKKIAIYATDGTNSLIDSETNKIAIIGFQYIDDSEQFLPESKERKVKMVELFFDSNYSDYWYFGEDEKLLFNYISERRKSFEKELYREVTKVSEIRYQVFLNHITSTWSGKKLGFF
ncbi:hypothetical protein [Aurantibacillus circumpalustris]|uniref:hypothetical protein n=1 Tax=Aurantibacillus circumpalustris TaxID=3036359 RepID=UPI00295A6BC0|nr:hypothetical protein [Aurantibacillus circumpalustris]